MIIQWSSYQSILIDLGSVTDTIDKTLLSCVIIGVGRCVKLVLDKLIIGEYCPFFSSTQLSANFERKHFWSTIFENLFKEHVLQVLTSPPNAKKMYRAPLALTLKPARLEKEPVASSISQGGQARFDKEPDLLPTAQDQASQVVLFFWLPNGRSETNISDQDAAVIGATNLFREVDTDSKGFIDLADLVPYFKDTETAKKALAVFDRVTVDHVLKM